MVNFLEKIIKLEIGIGNDGGLAGVWGSLSR